MATLAPTRIGDIFQTLATVSARPRYAFMVLNLIGEAAKADGEAGPWVREGNGITPIRDWLTMQLMPMSAREGRRANLRVRVKAALGNRLTGEEAHDNPLIDAAVDHSALTTGKANVSRAVSDLVRAGLVRRHYAGRVTDHAQRGGGRHAVYKVDPEVLAAIRTRSTLI
jgi:hypothetical protein